MAEESVLLKAISPEKMIIKINGISPLQTHRFGESALEGLRGTTMQKPQRGKKKMRDPEAEYKEALYVFGDDTVGFPAIMIKKAMINACRLTEMAMTEAKQMFFVWGGNPQYQEYCAVQGVEPEIHEAIVPAAKGKGATLSYRAIFPVGWYAEVVIEHLPEIISKEKLVNLLSLAGFSVGIGCQRPERGGQYGRFEIG